MAMCHHPEDRSGWAVARARARWVRVFVHWIGSTCARLGVWTTRFVSRTRDGLPEQVTARAVSESRHADLSPRLPLVRLRARFGHQREPHRSAGPEWGPSG